MTKMIKTSKFNVWMLRVEDIKVFKITHRFIGDPYVYCVFVEPPLFSLELRWQTAMNILLNMWSNGNEYNDDTIILIAGAYNTSVTTTITEDELNEINNVWNGFYEGKY